MRYPPLSRALPVIAWATLGPIAVRAGHHPQLTERPSVDDVAEDARRHCALESVARRYSAAIAACDRALTLAPGRAEVLSNRGVAWLMQGDAARAAADFSAAIEASPQNPLHYFNRALAEETLGQWRAAIADYGAAIDRASEMAIAFNNRGLVRERVGDRVLVRADYARAVAIDLNLTVAVRNHDRMKD